MKNENKTSVKLLLAAAISASTLQTSYAQKPLMLMSEAAFGYDASSKEYYPSDTTYYVYGPNAVVNPATNTWLFDRKIGMWEDNGSFKDRQSLHYTLDTDGKILKEYEAYFNNGKWDTTLRVTHSYNGKRQDTASFYEENPNGSGWMPLSYTTNTYSPQDSIAEYIYKSWDANINSWVNKERIIYEYYPGSRLHKETNFEWIGNAWQPSDRYTYHYIGNAIDSVLYEGYDDIDVSFSNKELAVHHYNAKNDLDTTTNYEWGRFDTWEYTSRLVAIHDYKNKAQTRIAQEWIDNQWRNRRKDSVSYIVGNLPSVGIFRQSWDEATGEFKLDNSYREHYHYQAPTEVVATPMAAQSMRLYPNPADKSLTIEGISLENASYEIYSLMGRKIKQGITSIEKTTIDVSDLSAGQYILRLSADKIAHKRFTVIR